MIVPLSQHPQSPLTVEEVVNCLHRRWSVTYDLQLVVRKKRLYLHIMWAFLEQQSFPLNEQEYREHLNQVLEIINRTGQSGLVRQFLLTTPYKPRLGRAISLQLRNDERLKEFVLENDQ